MRCYFGLVKFGLDWIRLFFLLPLFTLVSANTPPPHLRLHLRPTGPPQSHSQQIPTSAAACLILPGPTFGSYGRPYGGGARGRVEGGSTSFCLWCFFVSCFWEV
ncbi:hypothetical protein GGS23DRAFT_507700 [Durotheca rogersii]|uniref:uncharacterized protein n=1 Tax=Durotheca rogersii TaxID=419775 RepID=UPI00221E5E68|nr:uncharacterized protein GGS23DRAFT_507700 [Durotheca rogersii]KAI5863638.1 hypothetical protein GGS23DRAFT_507700 [Durotheca rogersii]